MPSPTITISVFLTVRLYILTLKSNLIKKTFQHLGVCQSFRSWQIKIQESLWYICSAIMDTFISLFFLHIIFKFKLKYVSCKTFLQNIFVLFFSHMAFDLNMKCWEQFNWITKLINWNELLPLKSDSHLPKIFYLPLW